MKSFLPLALDVSHRPILLIGGGKVAAQKLKTLCLYATGIRVVASEVSVAVRAYPVQVEERPYAEDVLRDAFLVYACTDDRAVNRQIAEDVRRRGYLVNAADDPDECDFVSPAVIKRGDMSVAVTSNGRAPLAAVAWRNALARCVDEGHVPEAAPSPATPPPAAEGGRVWLVGFGPGDPDLLTLKAHRLLTDADVIYYDDLTDPTVLSRYRGRAVYVGKRPGHHSAGQDDINAQLVASAREGLKVVRLKGGDPTIFGRGGEELDALRAAGISVEIVPGVTAACAAAAAAGVSLTHRGVSREVIIRSGHGADQETACGGPGTLVYYMAASRIKEVAAALTAEGWDPATPVILARAVGRPSEKIVYTDVASAASHALESPVLVIVGRTARRPGTA